MTALPTFSAIVHPWHCDTMGHMNTRFYAAIFDDASLQLFSTIAPDDPEHLGWADITWNISYTHEVKAGACVRVFSHIVEFGTKSLTISHSMTSPDGSRKFAEGLFKIARFDRKDRRAVPIEEHVRRAISEIRTARSVAVC